MLGSANYNKEWKYKGSDLTKETLKIVHHAEVEMKRWAYSHGSMRPAELDHYKSALDELWETHYHIGYVLEKL